MTHLPQALLDTVLDRLAPLLSAAANPASAREAIREMLAGYRPENANELALAAEIITLQLHTLEALGHAANPELSLNKIVRLRGSAVSLSREQHKAHRKLDQLQRARHAGIQPEQAEAPKPSPKIEKAIAVVAAERPAPLSVPNAAVKFPPLGSFDKLEAARRITENLKRKQAEHASQIAKINAATASAQAVHQAI